MPQYSRLTPHRIGIMAIVIAWVIWGAHPIAAKFGLADFPTFTLIFYRLLLATLILLPFTIQDLKKHKLTLADLKTFFIASLLGITLNITFYFMGLARTQAIDASLIGSFTPILNILAAGIILKESISRHEKIGVFLGFVGTMIIFIKPLLDYSGELQTQLVGNVFILLAAFTWVAFTMYSKSLFARFSPLFITSMTIVMGLITMFPLMLWEQTLYPNWVSDVDILSLGSLLYMVVFSTTIAYFLFESGLKYVKASLAGILSNIALVVAGILGVVILGETVSMTMLVGGFLITLGVVYSSFNDSEYHIKHHHRHR